VLRTDKEPDALLTLATRDNVWEPLIVKTVAIENKGIEDLATAIDRCREFGQSSSSNLRRQAIARWRIVELLRERLVAQTLNTDSALQKLDQLALEVANKQRDPYSAVDELMGPTDH